MAPIYDSDIAEERWSKEEWRNFELWEKIERRVLKKKRLWIALTAVAFVILSAIPVVMERAPKWRALYGMRNLAKAMGEVRWRAVRSKKPHRLLIESEALSYKIFQVESCDSEEAENVEVPEQKLFSEKWNSGDLMFLDKEGAETLGLGAVTLTYCYDPVKGEKPILEDGPKTEGFVILPRSDFEEHRLDRLSLGLLNLETGELIIQ